MPCRTGILLERSAARFKTPGLRDLSHSAPYLHDGTRDTLEDVVELHRPVSESAREDNLRSEAPELRRIALVETDVAALAAFLRSLDEDHE